MAEQQIRQREVVAGEPGAVTEEECGAVHRRGEFRPADPLDLGNAQVLRVNEAVLGGRPERAFHLVDDELGQRVLPARASVPAGAVNLPCRSAR